MAETSTCFLLAEMPNDWYSANDDLRKQVLAAKWRMIVTGKHNTTII